MQSSHTILLVEPACFRQNEATALDNTFQTGESSTSSAKIQKQAHVEFLAFRKLLTEQGVEVVSYKDLGENDTPDSLFPNNWFSTHQDSTLVLYPMKAPNRRKERRPDIIAELRKRYTKLIDMSHYEEQGMFLEATGSLVLDRVKRVAFAALSERTADKLAHEWAETMGYQIELFHSSDRNGKAIYHTNVLMSIGTGYALLALDCIAEQSEREKILRRLKKDRFRIVALNLEQLENFCGNVLEVLNQKGQRLLVMSSRAYNHFSSEQREVLASYAQILHTPLDTIERYGGGGARCMMAEIF